MADGHWRRATRRSLCPVCGKPDWCRFTADGRVAICNRVTSDRPAKGAGGGWVHRLQAGSMSTAVGFMPRQQVGPATGPVPTPASIECRHAAYHRLLHVLALGGHDTVMLERRGVRREAFVARGYRTLQLQGRSRIAARCAAGDTAVLRGVPGFWLGTPTHGEPYWTLAGAPGLVIPVRDARQRIRALRLRPRDSGDGAKYRWLSSAHKPGGCGSGAHCHVARPITGVVTDDAVWITEGEIKADIAADLLGTVVVSIPGVDLWPLALRELAELLPGAGRVVVALDGDWRDKPPVHRAIWGLVQTCRTSGYTLRVALWEPTHKGLDDLLTVGLRPTLATVTAIPPPAWTVKLSSWALAELPTSKARVTRPHTLNMARALTHKTVRRLARHLLTAAAS